MPQAIVLLSILIATAALLHAFRTPKLASSPLMRVAMARQSMPPPVLSPAKASIAPNMPALSDEVENISKSVDDDEFSLPDFDRFSDYFLSQVSAGEEMTKEQFKRYDEVQQLINNDDIAPEDVDDLWTNMVADAKGLSADEAYDLLCMVTDLPDPEEAALLDQQFAALSKGKEVLDLPTLLQSKDVKEMVDDATLPESVITDIWTKITGSATAMASARQYRLLSRCIDDALYYASELQQNEELKENIWRSDINIADFLHDETFGEMQKDFEGIATKGLLSWNAFTSWKVVKKMMMNKMPQLAADELEALWKEAVQFKGSGDANGIDQDTFVRLMVRLEIHMEDLARGSMQHIDNKERVV